ncbi:AGE family epimerase/isomerase [Parvularcula sp. LCG005]|uniref:AGE family epimerase/isomerase n=1 Tax=Parvularcula sp. LCG005 TaxID=3078805 RepID=UPI0029422E3C|nr:AGE family epimerase/isomerase [Parvularcula sp. LCG005]WOI53459.1 AGE family epimerase/isomerase [Parvularcula sp. LCG005]
MTSTAANPAVSDAVAAMPFQLDAELRRVTAWWLNHSIDEAHGGFLAEIGMDGQPEPKTPKRVILNTRILWSFSTVAMHTDDPHVNSAAKRARDYVLQHFVDQENGGVVWDLNAQGDAINTRKQGYAQAFALYGLAAYHRAFGDADCLEMARSLFECLEQHFRDPELNGYWEAFAQDWSPLEDVRLSEKDANAPKSMNTHLHILEAYTELYRSWPDPALKDAILNLIELHIDRIYDADSRHLRLFWDNDWTDTSEAISYGHDIEASWLIWEAAEVVGDEDILSRCRPAVLGLAEACLHEATGPNGELLNEKDIASGHVDATRIWWVQAEAMVGFLNAYQMTGDGRYLTRVQELWSFIERHVIDPQGEWRWHSKIDADENPYWAGPWKSFYHNSRALIEAASRLRAL